MLLPPLLRVALHGESCCPIGFSTQIGRLSGNQIACSTEKPWHSLRFMRRVAVYVVRVRICTSHELCTAGATSKIEEICGFFICPVQFIGGGSYQLFTLHPKSFFPVSRHTHYTHQSLHQLIAATYFATAQFERSSRHFRSLSAGFETPMSNQC